MTEAELKLVELDPNKQYVIMFRGSPARLKWPDKPSNVSSVLINADRYSIEDIKTALEALSNESIDDQSEAKLKGEQNDE